MIVFLTRSSPRSAPAPDWASPWAVRLLKAMAASCGWPDRPARKDRRLKSCCRSALPRPKVVPQDDPADLSSWDRCDPVRAHVEREFHCRLESRLAETMVALTGEQAL